MTWIVAGITAGSSLFKGFSAMGNKGDVEAGRVAAGQIQQEQLGLLGEQKDLALSTTQSEFESGQRNIGMGANMELRRTQAFGDQAYSQSNLATSGTIDEKVATQTGDLMAKYKSDMTKLFETREFAGREKDLQLSRADLSYREGEMSAEDAYQATLTGLESQPTGFLEGMFS